MALSFYQTTITCPHNLPFRKIPTKETTWSFLEFVTTAGITHGMDELYK